MTGKSIRPRPGVYNGIQFRSQLEIAWAKWMDGMQLAWEYVDESAYDFFVMGLFPNQPSRAFFLETKPPDAELCSAAIAKLMQLKHPVEDGQPALIIGHPTECYGTRAKMLVMLKCDVRGRHDLYAPLINCQLYVMIDGWWRSLLPKQQVIVVTCGDDEDCRWLSGIACREP